jgi:hypothetical protein
MIAVAKSPPGEPLAALVSRAQSTLCKGSDRCKMSFGVVRSRRIITQSDSLARNIRQVKLTFGASRASGLAISSGCAGWKPNMPAAMLLGKVSRALL